MCLQVKFGTLSIYFVQSAILCSAMMKLGVTAICTADAILHFCFFCCQVKKRIGI